MDVHDIVTSPPKHMAHLTPQSEPNGYARLRSIAVDRLTSAKPNDVWLFLRALDVRRDDVDVMSATVIAEGVDARGAVDALAGMRSVHDARVYARAQASGRWRLLTLAEQRSLWSMRAAASTATPARLGG